MLTKDFTYRTSNPTNVIFRLKQPAWDDGAALTRAGQELPASGLFTKITGPLDPTGYALTRPHHRGGRLGVGGGAPALYDVSSIPDNDLSRVTPVAILVIDLGGSAGLTFILPFLMSIFLLVLGRRSARRWARRGLGEGRLAGHRVRG